MNINHDRVFTKEENDKLLDKFLECIEEAQPLLERAVNYHGETIDASVASGLLLTSIGYVFQDLDALPEYASQVEALLGSYLYGADGEEFMGRMCTLLLTSASVLTKMLLISQHKIGMPKEEVEGVEDIEEDIEEHVEEMVKEDE